jgi:hypothetical protein
MSIVRASRAQAELFLRNAAQASGAPPRQQEPQQPKPRQKKRREELPENIVEGQIKDFLELRHWTLIRQHVGLFVPWHYFIKRIWVRVSTLRPVSMGEKGMSDWAAVRVQQPGDPLQFFYYEAKASGSTPSPEQRQWLEQKHARGFICGWFDDYAGDWPSSFLPWYKRHFGESS